MVHFNTISIISWTKTLSYRSVIYDLCIALYSFNQVYLIYHGRREFTSTDFSKLSVLQRLFSFMIIRNCPLSVFKRYPKILKIDPVSSDSG